MQRLVVLVLDAASPDLVERWTEDGSLPNLKRLKETGGYGRLDSIAGWLPEAASFAFVSGQNPAATGIHCHMMWDPAAMKIHPPSREWLPHEPFWRSFGPDGARAVVVDPSNVYPPLPFNGVEIHGWANHDTLMEFQTYPPDLAGWVRSRFGSALLPDEMYGLPSRSDFVDRFDRLMEINHRFAELCTALMQKEEWNLFMATNGTLHDGGHRLWSTANIKEPLNDTERHRLNECLHEVYASCDAAVGRIVAAAGDSAAVMVLSIHGMSVNSSRTIIFPEMVARVMAKRAPSRGLLQRIRAAIPVELRHAVKSRLPVNLRRGLTGFWRNTDRDWGATRAFDVLSDTHGWVRINLKGREALGTVEPGSEYDALCAEISEGLQTFVDADTGERVVQQVARPAQLFEGARLSALPDLIVRWADSPAAAHRAIRSPRFGEIPWPTPGRNPEGRGGNHRSEGMLITAGPGVRRGPIRDAHILDLAPTMLRLLGQPVPAAMEGKPLQLFD